LTGIKNHYENKSGSRFREFFHDWTTDARKGKWNENEIVVKARMIGANEPTYTTAGIGTALTGMHFDGIFFDDIVTDLNVTTKDQMDKTVEAYKKSLSLLKPGGFLVMVGTRWHYGDLYGRIIDENKTKNLFAVWKRDAEQKNADGKLIFEDIGLTPDFLALQKQEQGSFIYSSLYKNEPADDDTSMFKMSCFSFYGSIKPDDLYITCTIDPAGEGEDSTAITVVGTDCDMNMYILDCVNEHMKPDMIVDTIFKLNNQYKIKMLGVEENFFRGMLSKEIVRRTVEERKENSSCNVFGIREIKQTRGNSKHIRILALQPHHERRALKFPGTEFNLLKGAYSELGYQMCQYTINGAMSPHDDLIDSLAMHLDLVNRGGVVKKAEPAQFTPAWLEMKSYNRAMERNQLLPRKLRQHVSTEFAFN
jgi:predicted phage terminase large subunit-like protein